MSARVYTHSKAHEQLTYTNVPTHVDKQTKAHKQHTYTQACPHIYTHIQKHAFNNIYTHTFTYTLTHIHRGGALGRGGRGNGVWIAGADSSADTTSGTAGRSGGGVRGGRYVKYLFSTLLR
jgi:S-adenosylmethionine synthetase